MTDWLFRREDSPVPLAVLQRINDFGIQTFDLVRPPGRFWGESQPPSVVQLRVDARRVRRLDTPALLLRGLPPGETWRGTSRRSQTRLLAWFLVCEDPERRLEAQAIVTLAHQASLVRHLLQQPVRRFLVADEVGLGKTVEAGLFVRELLSRQPGLRVLYLAPARLVSNVRREFERLHLTFRSWVSGADRDATLTDSRILASIHRACHPAHFNDFAGTAPWDLIVVDECHHLSDWSKGGGAPVRKMRLVQDLLKRLRPGGRLLLLSGTPHQGSPVRFENLLYLLREEDEPESALAGRVIYRTKDDVQDWDGNPLFPRRQVNSPLVLNLGPEHRSWLEMIHELFEPQAELPSQARRRAAGWRAGMALQWATSSVEAGLGYLVRQAVRAGWSVQEPALRAALSVLRPYRGGPPQEPLETLFARICAEVDRQVQVGDVEDIEDQDEELTVSTWRPDPAQLSAVLLQGVAIYHANPDDKWKFLDDRVLKGAPGEKVVLFAQPIETVTALARYLERTYGAPPSLIVGNQDEEERQAMIDRFWRPDGPRFLVSSRAGGEGLNLQVARRLVHVDVPWNPMELEQRVGRVHRFRSTRTIVVDTIVVKDSREEHAYQIARDKLRDIASTMVPDDAMESLFSRVMALVPPEELLEILGDRPTSPFSVDESRRLQDLVVQGYQSWRSFDERFKEQHRQIRALDPGLARWTDLERFAREQLDAQPVEGFSALRFRGQDGEVVEASERANVLRMGERVYACGDYGGMPVTGSNGALAEQLGLNVPAVAEALRATAFPAPPTGAAHLRMAEPLSSACEGLGRVFGVLCLARQTVRTEEQVWVESSSSLHVYVLRPGGEAMEVLGVAKGELLRGLFTASARITPESAPDLVDSLINEEQRLIEALRYPSEEELEAGVRHAITPLLAAVVAVGRGRQDEEVTE